jgi:hypothetical protein
VGNNEWLDIEVLDDYLEGRLDASMMHKVERVSLEDPFVAQALAGLTEAKKRTQTLSFLQKQLHERVAEKPVERKIWQLTSHRLSIAATAAVLFITVGVLFMMRESNRREQEQLAAAKSAKGVEVNLGPKVAATAPVDTISTSAVEKSVAAKQNVTKALDKALAKGAVIAKNNQSQEERLTRSSLQHKELVATKLKNETANVQTMVGVPTVAPAAPVQSLEGSVVGIQAKTDPNLRSVKGTVYDIYGRPLSGADVKMVGDDIRAITNRSGEFTLPVGKEADKVTLEVASLGFARKNVEAKVNENLNVRLDQDTKGLNEVVVAGTGAAKAKTEAFSKPHMGWKAFNEYLTKENKLYLDGSKAVVLSFAISEDGLPSDIKIEKSAGKTLDDEGTRLLKNGGKWISSGIVNYRVTLTIKF